MHCSASYSESSQMCLWANSSQLCASFLSCREEQKLSSKHHVTFKRPFLFYIGVQLISDVVIVSGGQQRDSVILIYVFILHPQTPPRHPGCHSLTFLGGRKELLKYAVYWSWFC